MSKAENGRALAAAFRESGMTQTGFCAEQRVSKNRLHYWLRKTQAEQMGPGRFVEVSIPPGGSDAVQVQWGELRISFSQVPSSRWLSDFVSQLTA